jgi:predicted dehydrogenase
VKKVRVGVVGVGYFGRFHAEKYALLEEVELVGISDIDPVRAEEVARRCSTQAYSRYRDLLGQVEAVSIAVPTRLHAAVAADFLERGVDVLLEKPMTSTLDEADQLIRLAEGHHRILQVGQLERFNGALLASKDIIRNPLLFESHRSSPFPGRGTDVDVVLDVMIHDIDILLSLIPSEVRSIQAAGSRVLTPQLDTVTARIEFKNGSIARMEASRVAEEKTRRTLVHQSNGTITIDYLSQKASFSRGEPAPGASDSGASSQEISVQKVDLLKAEILSFLESVRNRKPPRVSGRDGRRALEMALRIGKRATEKTVVPENQENIER